MSTDKPKPLGTVERDEHAWMETVKFLDAWNGPTHIVAQAFETLKIDPIPVLAVELPGTGEGVYFTREMLASFIAHAQAWLATGSLEIPPAPPARTVDIKGCSACGRDHAGAVAHRFPEPVGNVKHGAFEPYHHWATCPTTHVQILISGLDEAEMSLLSPAMPAKSPTGEVPHD